MMGKTWDLSVFNKWEKTWDTFMGKTWDIKISEMWEKRWDMQMGKNVGYQNYLFCGKKRGIKGER